MEEYINVGIFLFSQAVTSQLSSALLSLTSVFGMGTGGPSASSTPTYLYLLLLTFWVFGDPYGTRTHVAAVRGRSLNRLTNGPILFSTVELIPQLHRLVRHQGFEPGTP